MPLLNKKDWDERTERILRKTDWYKPKKVYAYRAKSHTSAPDIDIEVEAMSLEEAYHMFSKMLHLEGTKEQELKNIGRIDEN